MSKSDVGMEDAEKLQDDSGNNNIQESECKVVEAKDERVEEVPCSVAPSGDVNGSSNGGEDPKHRDKEKDETNEKTEVKDQSNPTNEASEPIEEGSAPKCRDEEKGDTNVKTEAKDQSSPVVASEPTEGSEPKCRDEEKENRNEKTEEKDQISPVNEASEPIEGSDPKCRDEEKENRNEKTEVKYQISPVNVASESIEGSDPKCRDADKDNTNEKTEVKDQTNPMNEVSEPKEGSDREIITTQNENKEVIKTETETEAQTAASSAVEQQSDEKNEVVEHEATNSVAKEDDSTNNDLMDVERPNNDIMQKKPKQIGDDTDNTAHVLGQAVMDNVDSVPAETLQLPELSANKDPQAQDAELNNVQPHGDEEMEDAVHSDQNKMVIDQEKVAETSIVSNETVGKDKTSETAVKHDIEEPSAGGNEKTFETAVKPDTEESSVANQQEAATPNSLIRCSTLKNADHSGETAAVAFTQSTLPLMGEDDDGTPEEQAAFMKELEQFYRERSMDFKPPKFYGHPLNCLKLWRATIKLGGYDRISHTIRLMSVLPSVCLKQLVTGSKLWRQVGESFHPPKTCTTVSWTFRIFYEKSLLEYERYKTQSGELRLPIPMLPEVSGGDIEGNGYQGSGRARKDSAARATQGRNAQRVIGAGEIGDPIIKDKNLNDTAHNEKNLKSIGSLKQKRPNEVEHSNKAARTDVSKQLVTSVVDVGSPADWVKINVRQTKECFEVYALVPGLLREEVRVQSDPAGRLVITGQPEQLDNPWGITPFKKVISLPARIDPFQTSAVVSLHGRLLVRVPFEQTTN